MRALAIHDRGRGPELVGTRTTVYDLIPYLQAGHTHFYIAAALGLSSREVDFMVQYINDHYDEVMAENKKIDERIARGNPPEILEKLKGSEARLLALRDELRRKKQAAENHHEGNSRG